MLTKNKLLFIFCCIPYMLFSQEDAWVYFKDKANVATYLSNPNSILSQRAIDRRQKQGIKIDEKDVPITASYYNQIKALTTVKVLAKSKWMNAIHVRGSQNDISSLKSTFSFIDSIQFANRLLNAKTVNITKTKKRNKFLNQVTNFNYGDASNQIKMLSGHVLHEKGYTGKGMHIAIMDAGFPNVSTLPSFERLRTSNNLLGGYNFVGRRDNFYVGSSHGTHVLSTMAGYIENKFVGTAPDASFYLFITENSSKEEPLEESLWVEAAEKADSLGVDVINTSLGYSTFDKASYNYTYKDMDGKTTFISRGAELAASRGMLVVVSAGNEGNKTWKHITAPADAKSVLTIGAVKSDKTIASFSSRGLTADGRIKPDVMAQGQGAAATYYRNGNVVSVNGTSFSSPILAGVATCLWQANPKKKASEIRSLIRQSSDKATSPNADFGYGIPNFEKALKLVEPVSEEEENPQEEEEVTDNTGTKNTDNNKGNFLSVYPNPTNGILFINKYDAEKISKVTVYDLPGNKLLEESITTNKLNLSKFKEGIYFIKLGNEKEHTLFKVLKKNESK